MNECNSDSDDERKVLDQTWHKLQQTHLTNGYREGALAGEDKQFQSGFDKGFAEGFRTSHDLAVKHGVERILRFAKTKDQGFDIVDNLRGAVRALCEKHAPK